MAEETAQSIVNTARDLVGVHDKSKLRDGFSTDDLQADVSILHWVKEGLKDLLDTGYAKCYMSLALDKATSDDNPQEYKLSPEITEVLEIRRGSDDGELIKTTIGELNRDYPGWRSANQGTVTHWWANGDVIGFYPMPDDDTETAVLFVDIMPTALSAATDTPDKLPSVHHTTPAYYAAAMICSILLPELAKGGGDAVVQSLSAKVNLYREIYEGKKEQLARIVQSRHTTQSSRKFTPLDARSRARKHFGRP